MLIQCLTVSLSEQMRPAKKILKRFFILIALLAAAQLFIYYSFKSNAEFQAHLINLVVNQGNENISWENSEFIKYEANRRGPGENNEHVILTDPADLAKNNDSYKKEGFYVVVSDKISPDRALPDRRPKPCSAKKYLKKLPKASVVITFHNEVWSVLLRCVHSIYNRTPKELLYEIVLVNDGSTFPELYEPLQKYFNGTFDSKVKIHVNEKRQGLIKGRVTGARVAEAEVVVFLDSHMEVTNTWLPPLLDVLVHNPTYAAVPLVDGTNFATFGHEFGDGLFRGTFDWSFRYNSLPIRKKDRAPLGGNYKISCMTGGAYAIRRQHFFYLGAYDEEMKIYNGENYELSLKLWLCGDGGLIQVPCSRIVHLNKMFSAYRTIGDNSDFSGRNLKRVAEVWLDDYKKYFYRTQQARFDAIDAGDLTQQFELKKKLQCKPFQYYLDVVAPEILERFPINPQFYALGSIQNLGTKQCLILQEIRLDKTLIQTNCSDDLMKPAFGSNFTLTFEKSIGYNNTYEHCLAGMKLEMDPCHHSGGNQRWKFNIKTRQIYFSYVDRCLGVEGLNSIIKLVNCDVNSDLQKWKWGWENTTAINNWDTTGLNWNDFS